jgi:hypothetical protein
MFEVHTTETLSADEMRELRSAITEAFDHYHNAMECLTRFSGDASHQLLMLARLDSAVRHTPPHPKGKQTSIYSFVMIEP